MERLSLSSDYNPDEFAIHSLRYLPLRRLVKDKNVLDIACGEGIGTNLMSQWGAKNVTGVDISESTIIGAKERAAASRKKNLRFICDDAVEFLEKQDKKYNIIACVETIEHLPDPERFLKLCKERLTPNGILLVSCPNDYFYYGGAQTMNRFHTTSYSFDAFRTMAEGILGEGDWALGTMLSGFGLVPADQLSITSDTYAQGYIRRQPLFGERLSLPSRHPDALSAKTSIFYVGIWGPQSAIGSLAVSMPTGADYRMREVRAVSPDISLGVERRLAFVHDETTSRAEVDALAAILSGKYKISALAWTGDAADLSAQLFDASNKFDNIHFESEDALTAVMSEIDKQALDASFGTAAGASWVGATLTVRTYKNKLEQRIKELVDGTFTYSAGMPMLWSAPKPDTSTTVSSKLRDGAASFSPRVAVVVVGASDRNLIDTSIAPLPIWDPSQKEQMVTVDVQSADEDIAKVMKTVDVVICLDATAQSRNAVAQALRCGLPIILPSAHPFAGLVDKICHDLVVNNVELPAIRKALKVLQNSPDTIDTIRRESLELAEDLASVELGVAWTRAFSTAQQVRRRQGGPLRAAYLRNRAECYQLMALDRQNNITSELVALREECGRLRHENFKASRLIADLTAGLKLPTKKE